MASQTITAPKRATKPKHKATANAAGKKSAAATNGKTEGATPARRKPIREMTLEELSLRAYKMTYERLHGSKKKKK